MRIRITTLLILFLFLFTCNIADAERIKGKGASDLWHSIDYDSNSSRIVTCENGLVVEFASLQICDMASGDELDDNSNCYWYKAGLLGITHILGVQGVYLKLTNPTDKLMVVKWSESSLNLGTFNGIPFLSGMKYRDAGNPSATPDTIIPANKSVKVGLFLSNVSFSNGEWIDGYAYVRADKSLKANIYMKVLNASGGFTYCAAESPIILVPDAALQAQKAKNK